MDLALLNKYADRNLVAIGTGCSGTIVDPAAKLVFTAYHCIANAVKIIEEPETDEDGQPILDNNEQVKKKKTTKLKTVPVSQVWYDDKTGDVEKITYSGEIIGRDAKLDVAILRLDLQVGPIQMPLQLDIPTIPLAPENYVYLRGSTMWHVGNPIGKYGTITKGIISSNRDIRNELGVFYDNRHLVQYDGGLAGGSSGGALYDDEGVYIGTATAAYMDRGSVAYFMGLFVPMTDFYKVAERNCIQVGSATLPEKCSEDKKAE